NPLFIGSYSGLVNGDTPSMLGGSLLFSTPADGNSPVGAYSITPGGLTSSNYSITFVSGTLTIINWGLQPDTTDPTKTMLVVGGTTGDDNIVINPIGNTGMVQVTLNNVILGSSNPTGR